MRWSSDYFAENDVWSLCIICGQPIVLISIHIMSLTEVSYFRSSLFRRFSSAVAPHDSYPRFRPKGQRYRALEESSARGFWRHSEWIKWPTLRSRPIQRAH
jgi:hypothetical protein